MTPILLAIGSLALRTVCSEVLQERGFAILSLDRPLAALSTVHEVPWAAAIVDASEFGRDSFQAISLAADAPIIGIGWQGQQLSDSLTLPLAPDALCEALERLLSDGRDDDDRLSLNATRRTASWSGLTTSLTPTELRLLGLMNSRAPRPVSLSEFLHDGWGTTDGIAGSDMVRSHLRNLRRKLRRIGLGEAIRSRRGEGYYLELPHRQA